MICIEHSPSDMHRTVTFPVGFVPNSSLPFRISTEHALSDKYRTCPVGYAPDSPLPLSDLYRTAPCPVGYVPNRPCQVCTNSPMPFRIYTVYLTAPCPVGYVRTCHVGYAPDSFPPFEYAPLCFPPFRMCTGKLSALSDMHRTAFRPFGYVPDGKSPAGVVFLPKRSPVGKKGGIKEATLGFGR